MLFSYKHTQKHTYCSRFGFLTQTRLKCLFLVAIMKTYLRQMLSFLMPLSLVIMGKVCDVIISLQILFES